MTITEEPVAMGAAMRGRSVSDAMSRFSANLREANVAYAAYTQEEVEGHFARFKQYDLENTGFVTPADLKVVLEALDLPEITYAQCANMIEEVAILVGHEHDGRLSFRDYFALMTYEAKKLLEDEVHQAAEELRTSLHEEPIPESQEAAAQPPVLPLAAPTLEVSADESALAEELHDSIRVEEPEEGAGAVSVEPTSSPAAPIVRKRGSSFAVLDTIATSRIERFEQVIQDTAAKGQTDPRALYQQRAFESKLAKFRALEQAGGPAALSAEDIHKKTLKAKLHAFEAACKKEPPVAFKETWRNVRTGCWQPKKMIAGGVAPKKSIQDWL
jgi:hypothetical protein